MPAEIVQEEKQVVDLDKTPQESSKLVSISKIKFSLIIFVLVAIILLEAPGFYYFGTLSNKNTGSIEKKAVKTDITPDPGIRTVNSNEDVTVNSGIILKLEESVYDAAYEKQKNESKAYYANNASQSAYLDSDYYKNSQLNLKISLRNPTKKVLSYSPTSFRLKDSQDNQYVANYDSQKPIYGLNPDEITKLTLNFIVPTAEKQFRLIYENAVIKFTLK